MPTAFRARVRQEASRFALGMRRALGCAAFASLWVGAWLLLIWWVGSQRVYADVPHAARHATEASDTSDATEGTPSAIQRVAGHDAEPDLHGLPPERAPGAPRTLTPRDAYALDGLSRAVTVGDCPEVALTTFAGDSIAFSPAARVTPAFRPRLVELERIVGELARAFYGQPPSAILVAASYDCRSVSGKNQRLSEHAFGNAIDIASFRFAASDGAAAFEVRVAQHWKASGDAQLVRHADFLAALTRALLARDVFRTLLGPAHPDHADHFHFDMAPGYYVDL